MRIITLFFLFISYTISAQTPLQNMASALDKMKQEPDYAKANISFTLIDQASGKILLEKNKDMPLAPASTLKTFITAVALKRLGENYQYKTRVTFKGTIENKKGLGQLIIYGSGDPSLGSDRYKETKAEWVKQQIAAGLHKLGIETFQGNVKVVSSIFTDTAINAGWLAEDVGNYYGAGVYGLNWRENKFEINMAPTKTSFVVTSNSANYDNQKDFCIELIHKDEATTEEAFAYIEPNKPCMYVIRGVLSPKEKTHNMQLARLHPADDLSKELVAMLKSEFQFEYKNVVINHEEQVVTTIVSPPLSQLVYWCNQKSLNLYAEAFCKTIAAQVFKNGTWASGIQLMIQHALLKKINMKKVYLVDACGLSASDRITTNILATLLRSQVNEKYFKTYYESLPSMNGIIMKSGYIGGTRSYAGYLTLKDGRKTCFAFIVNNYACKPKEVKLKMYHLLDMIKTDVLPRE
jgi:serine-type D-Ala-D-Ala carboxypeptidase/endopeptidase (penicillin-binding protein 4)